MFRLPTFPSISESQETMQLVMKSHLNSLIMSTCTVNTLQVITLTFKKMPQLRCPVDNSDRYFLYLFYSLERNRLRVADLGVIGGGRPWALAAADDRKVEK